MTTIHAIEAGLLQSLTSQGRRRVQEMLRTGMTRVEGAFEACGLPRGLSMEDCQKLNARREDLEAAFAKVRPEANWKEWITGVVPTGEVMLIAAAIEFFTGSLVLRQDLASGLTVIEAPGYYESIGS